MFSVSLGHLRNQVCVLFCYFLMTEEGRETTGELYLNFEDIYLPQ